MFGRRRRRGAHETAAFDPVERGDALDDDFDEPAEAVPFGADETVQGSGLHGPWDVSARSPDHPRVDLGALRVPVLNNAEVQLSVVEDQVVAATVIYGESALQLQVFAAPKSGGLWDEARAEVARTLAGEGGHAREVDGPFGRELRGELPVEVPDGGVETQPARFVGVDGPRWLLRGVFTGPAGSGPPGELGEVFRGVVVVRGDAAMPPGEPLPLTLPPELAGEPEEHDEPGPPTIEMLRPGPEITETR